MATKVVFMTGSSSGIGLAVAKRLALDPDQRFIVIATVIALSEKADLETAVGSVLNKTVFIRELDILKDENITRVVDDVIKTYGRIDVLLNIAGVEYVKVPEDVTRKEMDHVLGVNLTGTIRLTQAVLPNMKQRMAGTIVKISSINGKYGIPYSDIYAASKFGVEGYFESLAASLIAFKIRVCLIEPGGVDTAMTANFNRDTKEYCQSGTINDIDRLQLSNQLKKMQPVTPRMSPDVIAEVLVTRCLDVDEPALRHLVCQDDLKAYITRMVQDLTGETSVSILLNYLE